MDLTWLPKQIPQLPTHSLIGGSLNALRSQKAARMTLITILDAADHIQSCLLASLAHAADELKRALESSETATTPIRSLGPITQPLL